MADVLDREVRTLPRPPGTGDWDAEVQVDIGDTADLPGPRERPPRHQRRGRRTTVAAVAAAAVAATLLAVAAPPEEPKETVEARDGPGLAGYVGRATVPVTGGLRRSPVTVLTGTHHLVWGGEDGSGEVDRVDGFTVELVSGTVEEIPNAPITRLSETDGAWTGTELVVVSSGACTSCATPAPSAAAWDPEGGWRGVAAPPVEVGEGTVGAVWTGALVVVVTRSGGAVAYDPGTDRWDDVPDVPDVPVGSAPSGTPTLVWTGSEIVLWLTAPDDGPFPSEAGSAVADRGWALDAGGDRWRALPDLPPGSRTQLGSLAWTGRELVAWGAATGGSGAEQVGVGARLVPGGAAWTPLPASPQRPAPGLEGTVGSQSLAVDPATGAVLVVPLDGSAGASARDLLLYDPSTDAWTRTDVALGGHSPTIAAADGLLLVPDPGTPIAADLS